MAWTLAPSITDPASGASVGGLCLAIKSISAVHAEKYATVFWAIYQSKAARETGQLPIIDRDLFTVFNDTNALVAGQYTPIFATPSLTHTPNPLAAAAYAALPTHPDPVISGLLVGAVEC
jgi:hypothetical protein